ncbi:MAG: hypothetical protein M3253_02900, partial [Chloroflexota bacterium]|nr:hypothetical protein [Chloroflexota bacterium]
GGGPQTEGASSGAATVGIRGCTFQPAILRVTGGSEVTFVNRDLTPHAVTGAGWGNAAVIEQGQSITHRFDEPGIQAYQCYLHPGMVGAIVVGDETSTAGDSTAAVDSTAPVDSTAADASPDTASLALLGLSAGVAFAAGVLIARPRGRA